MNQNQAKAQLPFQAPPSFGPLDFEQISALTVAEMGELIADVVEDSKKARSRQVYEMHRGFLRVLSKIERVKTKNYGVPLRERR